MATAAGQPGSRPDATGRRLEYLPAAVLGNGALLVTLSARGEVERLLWPHVDGPSHVSELRLGLRAGGHDLLARRGRECVASVVGGGRHLRTPHHGGDGVRHGGDRRRRRSARAGARSTDHGSSRRRRGLLRGAPRGKRDPNGRSRRPEHGCHRLLPPRRGARHRDRRARRIGGRRVARRHTGRRCARRPAAGAARGPARRRRPRRLRLRGLAVRGARTSARSRGGARGRRRASPCGRRRGPCGRFRPPSIPTRSWRGSYAARCSSSTS